MQRQLYLNLPLLLLSSCHVQLFMTPWTTAHHALLSSIISQSLIKFMFIKLVMLSNCLVFCHPLLLLPSIFSIVRVFCIDSAHCIRWPKYCSFSFNSSPSNEYSGLISFQIDWFHLLAVQGTLKSLLQHHSSKISVLQHATFFMVQLLHLHMTTGKTIALTIWTFVGKVTSLLFNMLSKFVILSLPRINHLLISWLQSPYTVILKSKKIKSVIASTFPPSICH